MPFQVISPLALCLCTIEASGPAEKSSWALNMFFLWTGWQLVEHRVRSLEGRSRDWEQESIHALVPTGNNGIVTVSFASLRSMRHARETMWLLHSDSVAD